ncbi:MAG: PAS domain S-box protein [Candidatus Aegiribacteria sp.]|nr:PAS domain S-box protein [Candidatus Aegiribacteria sp.]
MNEKQFDSYFELGLIGMAIVTPEMNFIDVNNYFCEMLGYSRDELLKKKWSELIYPDDLRKNVNALKKVLSGETEGYKLEKRLMHSNGSTVNVSIATKCTRKPDGSVNSLLSLVQDITERKKAEESIRESELKYRTVVENAREMIWQLDRDGNFVFFNKYAEELSTRKSTDWKGEDFSPAVHPDDLDRVKKIFIDTLSGNLNEYEVRIFVGENDIAELTVQTLPVYTDGEITGTLSFGRDITEEKRSQRALKASEERYRSLLENIPVGVFRSTSDKDGTFISVNPALARMFGFGNTEMMLRAKVSDCYHSIEDRERFISSLRKEGSVSGYEAQFKRLDASTFWGSLTSKATLDEKGRILYLDGILENITERKSIQEALRESEERYRRLLDHNPAAIVVHVNGKIVYANKASLDLVAASCPEDALGKMIFDFVHPDYRSIVLDRLELCQKDGKFAHPIEEKFLRLDGESVDVEVTAIPITYQGQPASQVVFWNITSRKQAEENIKNNLDELNRTLKGTVDALSSAVETRDPYTAGHQKEVARFACVVAKEMNLPDEMIEGLRVASLLHDIGKIKIPAEILSKPAVLTEIEYELIKTHPEAGLEILKTISFPWPVGKIVLQHQERIDGSGYPNGLKGDEICLEARILGVTDVVEAMCSHRPYRSSRGMEKALEEISQNKGILYDEEVVDACLKLFREERFCLCTT